MVLIREFRIPMPLTIEEFQVGQLYSLIERSRKQTTGHVDVEIISNEAYEDLKSGIKGQYTHKLYHMGRDLPRFAAALLPASATRLVEKAWNAYPLCWTEYSIPFLRDRLSVTFETTHLLDRGETYNAHGKPQSIIDERKVITIDIANPKHSSDADERFDPTKFKSAVNNRGPLVPGWYLQHTEQPIMCVYKHATIRLSVFGLQTKFEALIEEYQRKLLTDVHREIFCLYDQYYDLNMDDIRRLEMDAELEIAEKLAKLHVPT